MYCIPSILCCVLEFILREEEVLSKNGFGERTKRLKGFRDPFFNFRQISIKRLLWKGMINVPSRQPGLLTFNTFLAGKKVYSFRWVGYIGSKIYFVGGYIYFFGGEGVILCLRGIYFSKIFVFVSA